MNEDRYELDDVVERKRVCGFEIPNRASRTSLRVGDLAKLIFLSSRGGRGEGREPAFAERMWVEVTFVGPGFSPSYMGLLRNKPATTRALVYGQLIEFEPRHVSDVRVQPVGVA